MNYRTKETIKDWILAILLFIIFCTVFIQPERDPLDFNTEPRDSTWQPEHDPWLRDGRGK